VAFSATIKDFKFVMQNNLGSLPTILNFCSNVGAKLIYSGSSTKFANDVEGKNESPYAFTKAMNTELIKNYSRWFSLKYAIIYFYNVYGPGEISSGRYATVVSKFLKAFKNGETLPVVSPGTQKRNFTHIDDVVSGIKLVTELGEGDGYGIGSDESYTILDLAKLIGGEIRLVPQRKGNRLDSKLITSKTIDLGWEPKKTLKSYIYEKINS